MKLIGLMLARNEDWVIGLSLRAALKWVDGMVILDHASTDRTKEIVEEVMGETDKPISYAEELDGSKWDEMAVRQRTLEMGRELGGTHFAIIDADEILTPNLWMITRQFIMGLREGQLFDLPMIPNWRSVGEYRDDDSIWSKTFITLAFKDAPSLHWKANKDGYQHHNRPPGGVQWTTVAPFKDKKDGGIMHLQFTNWRRLRAKHYWYRMVEATRWPGRESNKKLNQKYNQALDETGIKLSSCPAAWLAPIKQDLPKVDLECGSWHEDEIRRLWKSNDRKVFSGLELPEDIIGEKVVWVTPIPDPPTGFSATAGIGVVTLSWTPVEEAKSYKIYRASSSGGPYRLLAVLESNRTGYADQGLKIGVPCYYVIRVSNNEGESPNSPQAYSVPLAPPAMYDLASNVAAASAGKTSQDAVPRFWICTDCALVGIVPYNRMKDKTDDMCARMMNHHRKESPGCGGGGFRLFVMDNVTSDQVIGRFK